MTFRRFVRLLGRVLLPRASREFILGDLEELYALRARRDGPWHARLRTARDLLASAISSRRVCPRSPGSPTPTRPDRRLLDDLVHDVRSALRALVREKGFTVLTVTTLALGVGSTAAVFGMVNQLVLRPLPGVADPGGAAYLRFLRSEASESLSELGLSTLDVDAVREAATFFSGMASYGNADFHVSLGDERPIAVWANTIYGDYFEVLGVGASEGRLLTEEDNRFGADPLVAVISEGLRARLFGNSTAAGRTIRVDGRSVTVVGVTANGFRGAERTSRVEMWVPYTSLSGLYGFTEEILLDRNSTMHEDFVVRLASDVTAPDAEGRVSSLLRQIAEAVPEQREYLERLRPVIFPGLTTRPSARASTLRTLSLMGGIVTLVLLIACANVANLLLFRNVTRRGSTAVHRALGASPARIARSHLTQGLILAGLGSLAGLGVASLITYALSGDSLLGMPAVEQFTVDLRVLAYAAAASVLTAALFGSAPAALAGRFDLGRALREAGGSDTSRMVQVRGFMAAGQIALSLSLLVGGVMLTRTVSNLYAVETGMELENVLTLPIRVYPEGQDRASVREAVTAVVSDVPGVEAVAATVYAPHGPRVFVRVQRTDDSEQDFLQADLAAVTPTWFELMKVRSTSGEPISMREETWRPDEAVLTASLARKLFGTEEARGRIFRLRFSGWQELRVADVTSDLRYAHSPGEPADAVMVRFNAFPVPGMTLLTRTASGDASISAGIRAAVEQALPNVPVMDPRPLADRLDEIHSETRMFSRLLGLLSTVAVVLAAVGLYGVIAFSVAARRREIGVRIALGASVLGIAGLVGRHAGWILLLGMTVGIGGAYALARVMESRLFGLEPFDVTSYALAATLFALTAATACWAPTRRAIRVDPMTVLKT